VASSVGAEDFLLCRVGASARCALPLGQVIETLRPLPVEPLAGLCSHGESSAAAVPRFVLGVAIIRGSATPVLDAGQLLGALEPCLSTRFVTLKLGARACALAVEEVLGVRSLPHNEDAAIAPWLDALSPEAVQALTSLDRQLLWVLECARLVPESVWQALEVQTLTHTRDEAAQSAQRQGSGETGSARQ
jgi:purine-binding chemotaxis protein CheW